ncbi:mechanosensitive ion channel family protein [Stieleria sp. JC731]|uniref:mechanosensitive ion channel family protein n=1 Tax=Pirellulaceae TaxID=2691357 RepID=UPI001E3B6CA3|nr:mechanosensitive ion channel family protein [Stieleria sp. JC731]MCC9602101.1 mechanosensitive ion channel family protein [Stieleria sp. JC731]
MNHQSVKKERRGSRQGFPHATHFCRRFESFDGFRYVAALFLVAVVTAPSSAQTLGGSQRNSVDGQRPKSTKIGFFELLESGSTAFLELFEHESADPTPEDPKWNSAESPRHAVMTFLEAMNHVAMGRDDVLDQATRTFGDSELDDAKQTALDLLYVFDRLPEIASGTIPGPEIVKEKKIRRYELFPRGIEHEWVYKALDDSPEGSIVLVAGEDGRWAFDEQTLNGASGLLDSMKKIPPRKRLTKHGNLFLNVLEPTVQKTTAWDWLFFIGFSAGGIVLAVFVGRILKRVKQWRQDQGDGLLLPLINGIIVPAYILIITIGLAIGSTRLHFHPTLAGLRSGLIEAAVVLAGVFLIVALIELAVLGVRRSFFSNDDPYAKMVAIMVRRAIRIVTGIVVTIFLLQNVLHWNVTALLGGFAIIALALSLAAQDAVKNLFGAFTVFATCPFLSGDWIRFEGKIGEVADVSLQATKIRLLSGEMYSVPNMKFIDTPVENLSMRQYLRRVMDIAITYDTPPAMVREAIEILKDILSSDEITGDGQGNLEKHPPKVWFDEFGSHYLNLRADYWYQMNTDEGDIQRDTERGWCSYLDHATIVNQRVLERFNEAGIDFAFPTQSLYLANDPDRRLVIESNQPQEVMS